MTKLTKTSVFVLPLIDKSFTKDFLLIDTTGKKDKYVYTFVNAFLTKGCINLVYRTVGNNTRYYELEKFFRNYHLTKNIYSKFSNNDWHSIISLQIPDDLEFTVNFLENSIYNNGIPYCHKIRILMFWQSACNSVLHSYLFDKGYKTDEFINTAII